jgi:hypothetical protein
LQHHLFFVVKPTVLIVGVYRCVGNTADIHLNCCLRRDEFGSAVKARVERSANRNSAPKNRLAAALPTVNKDFSSVSLIPKWSGTESAISLEEFFSSIEGHLAVDNVRTFYNSCPKLHGENVLWQNFETTFRKISKFALQYYECQGIRHFANKCPERQRWRGKTNNSPGKENPSEHSKSQGIRLNPGY